MPAAALLYAAGYVAVAVGHRRARLDRRDRTRHLARSCCGRSCSAACSARPAIAIGSGRAAIWTATLPASVLATAAACRRVLTTWLLVSLLAFVVALVTDFDTALNVTSQLGTDTGATVQLVVVSLLVVPNAVVFSGSYLLGPGFTVGTHTIVSPAVVTIGALPMFPLLAALPDTGPTPGLDVRPGRGRRRWSRRSARCAPSATTRRTAGRRARCTAAAAACSPGRCSGCSPLLAGGAVGPGRMTDVGPLAVSVLVHAVTAFGDRRPGRRAGRHLVAAPPPRAAARARRFPSSDAKCRSDDPVDTQSGVTRRATQTRPRPTWPRSATTTPTP